LNINAEEEVVKLINRVVLVGRLTKDPELRYTPNGVPVTRFTVAVNRTFTNQQGEREADFISCVAWRKQAENLANYMRKGSLVGIDGRIQTSSFEGQDGKRVYMTEVVADSVQFLEPRSAQGQRPYGGQPSYGASQPPYGGTQDPFGVPFPSQPPQNQPNYTRVDEDPFASSKGPIEVSEDDLPF